MLEAPRIGAAYGKHLALAGVDLDVGRGEIVVILGANGAGKSTLLKAIAGLVTPHSRRAITLDGHDLPALPPHEIVEAGVALVPEGPRHLRRPDGAREPRCSAPIRAAPAPRDAISIAC